jgi:hypothetical protein
MTTVYVSLADDDDLRELAKKAGQVLHVKAMVVKFATSKYHRLQWVALDSSGPHWIVSRVRSGWSLSGVSSWSLEEFDPKTHTLYQPIEP